MYKKIEQEKKMAKKDGYTQIISKIQCRSSFIIVLNEIL